MPTENVLFDTSDGLRLEGRLSAPEDARGAAVLCHPHPLYGGSMSSAIIPALQRSLDAKGWASVRFNFRGVGRSEGTFGRGTAEVKDVAAALDLIRQRVPAGADGRLAVAGWSFGALVGLAAATADEGVDSFVAIAPPVTVRHNTALPVLPPAERLSGWRARVLMVCGTEDEFCATGDLEPWAAEVKPEARIKIYPGEDHFFSKDKRAMTDDVAAFIAEP